MTALDQFRLDGRRALVTGGGRGLGEACARALADAGADVAVAARSAQELDAIVADIKRSGRQATSHTFDARDVVSIRHLVADVEERLGPIDILVNNAGTNVPHSVVEVEEEDWDLILDTNLKGAFFCAQQVGRRMLDRGRGKVINMASTFAVVGFFNRVAYAASKGGVLQMTRVMAVEWAARGIQVNAVGPTATHTRMNASLFADQAWRDEVLPRIPAGRFATPADVVGAVLYLASPAADMVNGHLLLVDGGWTAI